MNRRKFLSSAALAVGLPMPPGLVTPLRSPKDAEFVHSLRKVRCMGVSIAPRPATLVPLAGAVTGISISVSNGQAKISWQSGAAPFRIERQTYLGDPWEDIGIFTMHRTVTFPIFGDQGFFRIREAVPMQVTAEVKPDGAHISWLLPEL